MLLSLQQSLLDSLANPLIVNELLILFCTLLWGINSVINAPVSIRVGAVRLVFINAIVTLCGLMIVSPFILNLDDIHELDWLTVLAFLFLVSPSFGGGQILFFRAVKEIGVSRTQAISSTYPVLTTIASILFLKEHPTILVIIGSLAVIVGIGIISQSQTINTEVLIKKKLIRTKGFWFAVFTTFCFATGTILMKILLNRGFHPFLGNLLRAPGIIFFALLIFITEKPKASVWRISLKYWFAIIIAAIFCHMVADIMYFKILQSTDASIIIPIASATPIWIVPLAFIFLKERFNLSTIIGFLLTVSGVIAILI